MNIKKAESLKLGDKVLVKLRGGEVLASVARISHQILPRESYLLLVESPFIGSRFVGLSEIRSAG